MAMNEFMREKSFDFHTGHVVFLFLFKIRIKYSSITSEILQKYSLMHTLSCCTKM